MSRSSTSLSKPIAHPVLLRKLEERKWDLAGLELHDA